MNTNAQTMAWMMDAFLGRARLQPAIVTGKPLSLRAASRDERRPPDAE